MKEEFVTYKQALALKELGFDEPCLSTFTYDGFTHGYFTVINATPNVMQSRVNRNNDEDTCSAPLKQQAFRWLYVKTNKWIIPIPNDDKAGEWYGHGISYKSFEEAEKACIDKLLEIAKQ